MPSRSVPNDVAMAAMRERGVEPLTEYPGLNKSWPGTCLTCGAETKSNYYNVVVKGLGGCHKCGARKRHEQRIDEYRQQALKNITNSGFKPLEHFENGRDKVLVECLKCGSQIRTTPNDLKAGRKCSCEREIRLQPSSVSVSESMPELIPEWDIEVNGKYTPQNTGQKSHIPIGWVCSNGHKYLMPPQQRERGQGCPFCSGRQIAVGENDLATTHPHIASQWNYYMNGDSTPQQVSKGTNGKFWWLCPNGHDYESAINKRTSGRGCPICTNKILVSGLNDLLTMYPDLAAELHPTKNGALKPTEVIAGSHQKLWWQCSEGHVWEATTISRINGRGCASCANYGFKPNQTAILYFIQNEELYARKIGITNVEKQNIRLKAFGRRGWNLIHQIENDGATVAELEKIVLKKWIRKELGMPRYLGQQEMGSVGGWTETFSFDGPTNDEIIQKIELTQIELKSSKK